MKWGKAKLCLLILFILIAGGLREPGTNVCAWRHLHPEEKPRRTSLMCAQWKLVAPRSWGPGFQPGMWAALWATPLPATESEEGTQAGHQPCWFYQLLTGEGRAREKEKQTSSHGPAQMQIFLGGGGSVPRPLSTLPPGLSVKPNSGALRVGNCMFSRMQLVTGTQASSQLLWVAQTLHSPRPGFPLYSPQAGVHTTHSHCRSLAARDSLLES